MKLYYSSGSCSLSPRIVALEAGIPLETVKVDLKTKTVAGYVPALELDDGQVLTEGPAIVQFLADLKPESGLAPANGSFERVRLQEALNYITAELHKTYSPLFKAEVLPAVREDRLAYLRRRYALIDKQLAGRQYLVGNRFTVADAYLYAITRWARGVKLDLSEFPNVEAFQKRIGSRKAVLEALRAEGLIAESQAA